MLVVHFRLAAAHPAHMVEMQVWRPEQKSKIQRLTPPAPHVGREVITPGVAVTMRYTREGERMLVDRVVVQRPLAAETKAAASTEAPGPKADAKPDTDYEVKAIDKIRISIEQEERQLSGLAR